MRYHYSIAEQARQKAIRFGNRPLAHARIFGFWVDLWYGAGGRRAEFGPYLTRTEAESVGRLLVDIASGVTV